MHLYTIQELICLYKTPITRVVDETPDVKWLTSSVIDQVTQIFPWVHYVKEWYVYYPETADFIQLEGSVGGGARLQVSMISPHEVTITLSVPPKNDGEIRPTLFRQTIQKTRMNLVGGLSMAANHLTDFMKKKTGKFSAWKTIPDKMNRIGIPIRDIRTNKEYYILADTIMWLSPNLRTGFVRDGSRVYHGVEGVMLGYPIWFHTSDGKTFLEQKGVKLERCGTIPDVVSIFEIEESRPDDF